MSDYEYENEDDESQDIIDLYDGKKNVGVIFIDVCSTMFNSEKLFKVCLAAIYKIMDRMLLKAYRRNLAVCLLQDENPVLIPLDNNVIESVKEIRSLLTKSIDELRQQFERTSAVSLRNCLTEAIKQFANLEKVNPYVIVLTNDDNPHKGDEDENRGAINVALTLKELNIKLVVLPLSEKFDYGNIYKDLLQNANDMALDLFEENYEQAYNDVDKLMEILDCVIRTNMKIRRQQFFIYDNNEKKVQFWVQIRRFVKDLNLYKNANISRATNNKVRLETKSSNLQLDKLQYVMGRTQIIFDKNACLHLKQPFGFRLLYVSTDKQYSIHRLHKIAFVLQKDEVSDDDAKILFDYLWDYCHEKNRYLVCGFHIPGHKQHPRIVELIPDQFQGKPCFIGHYLAHFGQINLVTADSEELSKIEPPVSENDRGLKLMSEMIDKMKIHYNPLQWNSIAYDRKAAFIKANLLDTDVETVQCSIPNEDEVSEQLGEIGIELGELMQGFYQKQAVKRKVPAKAVAKRGRKI